MSKSAIFLKHIKNLTILATVHSSKLFMKMLVFQIEKFKLPCQNLQHLNFCVAFEKKKFCNKSFWWSVFRILVEDFRKPAG